MDRKAALDEIRRLFLEASKAKKEFANRHVWHARKIASSLNIRLPSELKRRFCRKCGAYFYQGKNVKTRISCGKIIYTCQECGKVWRKPIK